MTELNASHNAEIERIRTEYKRRRESLPSGLYAWSRPANLFWHSQLLRACIPAVAREGHFPLEGRRVLDVGCGTGTWLAEFLQWGAEAKDLCGIDLDEGRLETARKRLPTADLKTGDASQLPWPDATFDVVTQFTVFTSILDSDLKRRIASDMLRVLKPGGVVLWYDFRFNNPSNPNGEGNRGGGDKVTICRMPYKS